MTNQVVAGSHALPGGFGRFPAVVRETGPDGEKQYRIEHVLGGKNVFYFLALARPRDACRRCRWPLTCGARNGSTPPPAPCAISRTSTNELVHWTETPYTFNTACHSCHVSQLARNYDPVTETYHTTWKEPGINCETCHGPSRRTCPGLHRRRRQKPDDLKIISTKTMTPAQRNDHCSACHAKAMILSDAFPPGARLLITSGW